MTILKIDSSITGDNSVSRILTKRIVEAHGGTIACTPVTPHGTRFVLTLPRDSVE